VASFFIAILEVLSLFNFGTPKDGFIAKAGPKG